MTDFDADILLRARGHLSIAGHVPGQIRLKFRPAILKDVPELVAGGGKQTLARLDFIEDVKVNALGMSLSVAYDATRVEPEQWERLIGGSDDEAREVVAQLFGLSD